MDVQHSNDRRYGPHRVPGLRKDGSVYAQHWDQAAGNIVKVSPASDRFRKEALEAWAVFDHVLNRYAAFVRFPYRRFHCNRVLRRWRWKLGRFRVRVYYFFPVYVPLNLRGAGAHFERFFSVGFAVQAGIKGAFQARQARVEVSCVEPATQGAPDVFAQGFGLAGGVAGAQFMAQSNHARPQHVNSFGFGLRLGRGFQNGPGLVEQGRKADPEGQSDPALDALRITLAVRAVVTADNPGFDKARKMTAQGAFRHAAKTVRQGAVGRKDDGARSIGDVPLWQERQKGTQHAKRAMGQPKAIGGVCQGRRKLPFVGACCGHVSRQASLDRPPDGCLERIAHKNFTKDNKILPPCRTWS